MTAANYNHALHWVYIFTYAIGRIKYVKVGTTHSHPDIRFAKIKSELPNNCNLKIVAQGRVKNRAKALKIEACLRDYFLEYGWQGGTTKPQHIGNDYIKYAEYDMNKLRLEVEIRYILNRNMIWFQDKETGLYIVDNREKGKK